MTQHITVFGKPWCECGGDRRLFNLPPEADDLQHIDALFDLQDKARKLGLDVICMGARQEEAVKFLNDNGIPAELTYGPCPTLHQEDYK